MSEDSKILSEKDFKYELYWACVSASQASFKYSKKVQDSHDALRARITDLEAENHALRCCGNCGNCDDRASAYLGEVEGCQLGGDAEDDCIDNNFGRWKSK